MRRAAYVAALNRAKFVIENYSQSVHQEEALVLMVSCYDRLGIKDLRDDTERVLEKNYPNTKFNAQKIIENKAEWWEFWDSMIND
jgi:outer membrane protein assembly factor BamD